MPKTMLASRMIDWYGKRTGLMPLVDDLLNQKKSSAITVEGIFEKPTLWQRITGRKKKLAVFEPIYETNERFSGLC